MVISTFVIIFILAAIICLILRILGTIMCRNMTPNASSPAGGRVIRIDPVTNTATEVFDREANTCPQANGAIRENGCNDIFFIEPNSQEAARIRAQLEKDDKDLPSYDEVMSIANISSPTAAPATANFIPAMPSALTMGASSSSVNANDCLPSLPTYRAAETSVRPLTPPPYTVEPIGDTLVVPISIPQHSQQNTQST